MAGFREWSLEVGWQSKRLMWLFRSLTGQFDPKEGPDNGKGATGERFCSDRGLMRAQTQYGYGSKDKKWNQRWHKDFTSSHKRMQGPDLSFCHEKQTENWIRYVK